MPSPKSKSSHALLGAYYDLQKKELLLRFEKDDYARHYQVKNPEARIFAEHPSDVWLPTCEGMKALRNSDGHGMLIIFHSLEERQIWLKRSILGEEVHTSADEYAVRFKRAWARGKFEALLDYDGTDNPRLLKLPRADLSDEDLPVRAPRHKQRGNSSRKNSIPNEEKKRVDDVSTSSGFEDQCSEPSEGDLSH
jgi:hypothetical protein